METISIDKNKVLTLYGKSTKANKQYLEGLFGKETFTGKITDRCKSMADVYQLNNIKPGTKLVSAFHAALGMDEESIHTYCELVLMARTLNEGWVPDYTNSNERKYYPWFDLSSGSGLSLYYVDYSHSLTGVGARLVFKSEELAKHAVKYFLKEYTNYITIKKTK